MGIVKSEKQNECDRYWMQRAIQKAHIAKNLNEVPVGAILTFDDQLIAEGYNQPLLLNDPTAHAEMLTLRSGAKKMGNYRLINTTLYVTLEPCTMCAGALI